MHQQWKQQETQKGESEKEEIVRAVEMGGRLFIGRDNNVGAEADRPHAFVSNKIHGGGWVRPHAFKLLYYIIINTWGRLVSAPMGWYYFF